MVKSTSTWENSIFTNPPSTFGVFKSLITLMSWYYLGLLFLMFFRELFSLNTSRL